MSALRDALLELFIFMEKTGQSPPTRDVVLLEITPNLNVDESGRFIVKRSELKALEDFEARFDEILAAGLPWVNMSCYGVSFEKLVVCVEMPKLKAGSSSRTSVNYSGPPRCVYLHGWNASKAILFEESEQ